MADIQIDNREDAADWIETTLLVRGSPIGIDELNSAAREDCGLADSEVGLGLRVMHMRQRHLGPLYPFSLTDIFVAPETSATSSNYAALLFLSPGSPTRQLVSPQPTGEMTALFERLTTVAIQALMGSESRALRFGWPSENGRPERFSDAIDWLANQMGIRSGTAFRSPLRKDGGVDVVAWRPFPDKRSGFPVALVQCTVQRDIVPKSRDIDVRNWAGWLALDLEPATFLAFPGTVAKTEDWNEIALRTLVLDRIRITGLLNNEPLGSFDYGTEFVSQSISKILKHLSGSSTR